MRDNLVSLGAILTIINWQGVNAHVKKQIIANHLSVNKIDKMISCGKKYKILKNA